MSERSPEEIQKRYTTPPLRILTELPTVPPSFGSPVGNLTSASRVIRSSSLSSLPPGWRPRSRSVTLESPIAFYHDLTPLPSPIVPSTSAAFAKFSRSPSQNSGAVYLAGQVQQLQQLHSDRERDIQQLVQHAHQILPALSQEEDHLQPPQQHQYQRFKTGPDDIESSPVDTASEIAAYERSKKAYGELLPAPELELGLGIDNVVMLSKDHDARDATLSHPQVIMRHPAVAVHNQDMRTVSDSSMLGPVQPALFPLSAGDAEKFFMNREKSLVNGIYGSGETFTATDEQYGTQRSWREIRTLGRGTFSRVVLAAREAIIDHNYGNTSVQSSSTAAFHNSTSMLENDELVAIKIVEITSAGGASRDRIESGLQREHAILRSLNHPAVIRLLASNFPLPKENPSSRVLLVLPYCRGGDLFDLASRHRHLITPQSVKRLFAELASAVKYLHYNNIVHRDVKLENVLLTLPPSTLVTISCPNTFPTALTRLTDFGLSREIDPEKPLLTTRCGSEDYAAPEIIMGQSYDGRLTDAWSLGVLLYALIEGRFPFDPLQPSSGKSRVKHRIARVDWTWVKSNKSTHDDIRGEWAGAKEIVEGCLRRKEGRMTLEDICNHSWVKDGVQIPLFDDSVIYG